MKDYELTKLNYKYVIISLILHLIILPCASNCEDNTYLILLA